jgi:very-short-patch-repair endonuclease
VWLCGRDVARVLGYDNTAKAIQKHVNIKNKKILENLVEDTENIYLSYNEKNTIYISKIGLIGFLSFSKMPNKTEFIKWCGSKFNLSYNIITRLYKEQETIGQLIKVFDYKKIKTQYNVDGLYRIDLYFEDEKLAIECDEFNHDDRNLEYEKKRETYIREKLGCDFIRYNPDAPDFDIFVLIKQINMKLSL